MREIHSTQLEQKESQEDITIAQDSIVEKNQEQKNPVVEQMDKIKRDLEIFKKGMSELKKIRDNFEPEEDNTEKVQEIEAEIATKPLSQIQRQIDTLEVIFSKKKEILGSIEADLDTLNADIAKDETIQTPDEFSRVVLYLKLLLEQRDVLQKEIIQISLEQSTLIKNYKKRKFVELGAHEDEEYWDFRKRKSGEKKRREGVLGIRKIFNKEDLDRINGEIDEIDRVHVMGHSTHNPYYHHNTYRVYQSINHLEKTISRLERPLIEHAAQLFKEEKLKLIPEQIKRLEEEYIASCVLPKLEKERKDMTDEEYDKFVRFVTQSMSLPRYSAYVSQYSIDAHSSEEQMRKTLDFNAEIERLGHRLKSKIDEYRPEKSVSVEIQEGISLINAVHFAKLRKEFESILESYSEASGGYVSSSSFFDSNIRMNRALDADVLLELKTDIFQLIQNDEQVIALLGQDKIEQTKEYIQTGYIQLILNRYSQNIYGTNTVEMSKKLTQVGESEHADFIVLNAFNERGHHNDYPILKAETRDNPSSFLSEYIKKLSDEDIEDLRSKNIPGISELITFMKKEKSNPMLFAVHDSILTPEELEDKKFINENLAKLLEFKIKGCKSEQLNFYIHFARNIDCDLGGVYDVLKSVEDEQLIRSIINMTQGRLHDFKDLKVFDVLINIQKNNEDVGDIPKIFFDFINQNKGVTDEMLLSLAKESADMGLLSADKRIKIQSIKLLEKLGLDIQEHSDFIFKEIFEKEITRDIHAGNLSYFLDQIEKGALVFNESQISHIYNILMKKVISNTNLSDDLHASQIVDLFYKKGYITEEYYKKSLDIIKLTKYNALEDVLAQGTITQENWAVGLSRYAMTNAGVLYFNEETTEKLSELFSNNHPDHRELCLKNLQDDWNNFLKTGEIGPESQFVAGICKKSKGIGDLKYIENISYMIYYVNDYLTSSNVNKKTADIILNKLNAQEERFKKENWSEEDKSFFYSVSKDILATSPSLYTDFLDVFEKLQAKDMKVFIKDYFASYQAILVVLDKGGNAYDARELVSVRQQIREVGDQIKPGVNTRDIFEADRAQTAEFLKEKFVTKYGVVKIPEQFDQEKIKILENFIKYNSNINNKNKEKEAILAFYMALSLNGDWQRFREGQAINPEEYISGENLSIVKEKLSTRNTSEFIKSFDLDIEEDQIPELLKILEDDTIASSIGNIETVDVKLGTIKRAMSDLEDVDAYEHAEDKKVLELYKKEGKAIASTLSKMFALTKGQGVLSPKEEEIKTALSSIYQVDNWTQDEIKKIQESTRSIGLIHGILEKIAKEDIDGKISTLENITRPTDKIIAIFSKLDEDFKPNSGALALSEDLIYLENIIIKNQDKLTQEEQTELSNYLAQIRSQMNVLEKTIDNIKEYFDKLKKSIHGSNKRLLQEKLNEIEKIIYSNNKSINIVSRMTGNLSDVIKNIRECLGCLSPQCNNDTNLTFGEPYKFFMMSQNGSTVESIADQLVMCLPTTLENGEKTMSFVMDTVYGVKSADVLFGNIKTLNKKREAIKQKFPNIKTSITITRSTLAGVGLEDMDLFIQRYTKENPGSDVTKNLFSIEVPKSSLGDNYAEYGIGNVRPVGKYEKKIEGVVIQ